MKLFVSILSLIAAAEIQAKELMFEKSARVEKRDGCYFLIVDLRNKSNETMYLMPGVPAMELLDEKKRRMREVGIIADFGEMKPEDYEKVLPGGYRQQVISISSQFKFQGAGSYDIMLPGGYYDPLNNVRYPRPPITIRFKYLGEPRGCEEILPASTP